MRRQVGEGIGLEYFGRKVARSNKTKYTCKASTVELRTASVYHSPYVQNKWPRHLSQKKMGVLQAAIDEEQLD